MNIPSRAILFQSDPPHKNTYPFFSNIEHFLQDSTNVYLPETVDSFTSFTTNCFSGNWFA